MRWKFISAHVLMKQEIQIKIMSNLRVLYNILVLTIVVTLIQLKLYCCCIIINMVSGKTIFALVRRCIPNNFRLCEPFIFTPEPTF